MFDGIYDISSRDTHRDWSLSKVKTKYFDVANQPVTAYQNPWELAQMLEIYVQKGPQYVLELGPCKGGVLYHWMRLADDWSWPLRIAAVDWFDGMMGGDREAGPEEWKDWAEEFQADFKFFQGNTRDPEIVRSVAEYFSHIDWLFIDATHEYDSVMADLQNYGSLVQTGGVIAFHDIRPVGNGSHRVFTELQRAGYVTQELVADPNATEAGIGLVYL